jgi:hypothetical protein
LGGAAAWRYRRAHLTQVCGQPHQCFVALAVVA